jgi:outer membrane protein
MKKLYTMITLLGLLSLVFVGQPCFAQEPGAMAVGLRVSYVMIQDDSVELFSTDFDTSYDGAAAFSADFTYFINKSFSLEASIGYLKTDMDVEAGGDKEGYGTLTQIPILLTARYHIAVNEKVSPYVGVGIGYYYNDMDNADGSGDFFQGAPSGVEAFADNAFGFHLNAGAEFFINKNLALNVDLKYLLSSTDIGFDGAGYDESDSSRLNAFTFGVGIKYYF